MAVNDATVWWVNEDDDFLIDVTTNQNTTGLTLTAYIQLPDGTTAVLGTVSGGVADTVLQIAGTWDMSDGQDYRIWVMATDGVIKKTLWPDSTPSEAAEIYARVRPNPVF